MIELIGVPLDECPTLASLDQDGVPNMTLNSSSNMENVPLLVRICTSIVEQKGIEIVGMYRIPGNNAAVTQLTELVNKGPDHVEVMIIVKKTNDLILQILKWYLLFAYALIKVINACVDLYLYKH